MLYDRFYDVAGRAARHGARLLPVQCHFEAGIAPFNRSKVADRALPGKRTDGLPGCGHDASACSGRNLSSAGVSIRPGAERPKGVRTLKPAGFLKPSSSSPNIQGDSNGPDQGETHSE